MADDLVKRAREALDGVTLFVDQDGDVCCTGRDKNLVFCPACGDADENWQVLNPDIVQAIVDRFNAYPAMADRIRELEDQLATVLQRETETHARHDARVEALEAAETKLAKALEALRPFSNAADRIDHYDGEHYDGRLFASRQMEVLTELLNGIDGEPLTVDTLRSARATLKEIGNG